MAKSVRITVVVDVDPDAWHEEFQTSADPFHVLEDAQNMAENMVHGEFDRLGVLAKD